MRCGNPSVQHPPTKVINDYRSYGSTSQAESPQLPGRSFFKTNGESVAWRRNRLGGDKAMGNHADLPTHE